MVLRSATLTLSRNIAAGLSRSVTAPRCPDFEVGPKLMLLKKSAQEAPVLIEGHEPIFKPLPLLH